MYVWMCVCACGDGWSVCGGTPANFTAIASGGFTRGFGGGSCVLDWFGPSVHTPVTKPHNTLNTQPKPTTRKTGLLSEEEVRMHFPGAGPGGAPAPGGGQPTVASIVQGKAGMLVGWLFARMGGRAGGWVGVGLCGPPALDVTDVPSPSHETHHAQTGTAGGAGGLSPSMAGLPPPGQVLPR